MKKLILLFFIFFTQLSSASNRHSEMIKQIEEVSLFNKQNQTLTLAQLNLVIIQLKKVLVIDQLDAELDRSQEATFVLFNSYLKNKSIYLKAVEKMNPSERKKLHKIFKLIEEYSKNGNG
jgi:hypothetical protein